MNSSRLSERTIAYYDANAEAYLLETVDVPMGTLYESFLELVPSGGRILDAGCGSGRDAREFLRRGYEVTAIDASSVLARVASERTGVHVTVLRFEDMSWDSKFDGVWACASLLHVPRADIDGVFNRFIKALRPGGGWYVSFKLGEAEEFRESRLFSDYTEQSLRELVRRHPQLELARGWVTDDARAERVGHRWLNALLKRVGTPAS
jgi:SAM-dependent methyltransferase